MCFTGIELTRFAQGLVIGLLSCALFYVLLMLLNEFILLFFKKYRDKRADQRDQDK